MAGTSPLNGTLLHFSKECDHFYILSKGISCFPQIISLLINPKNMNKEPAWFFQTNMLQCLWQSSSNTGTEIVHNLSQPEHEVENAHTPYLSRLLYKLKSVLLWKSNYWDDHSSSLSKAIWVSVWLVWWDFN